MISPGKAGSRDLAETAFGQAAALMSVSQLARVGGTVAGGGIYRKCGPGMDLSAPCEERKILAEPNLAVPILSGMEQVVLAGTARGLQKPAGVRLYGKTGTADAIGTKDEIVFGVPYNEWGPPNSWFLGIAEDEHAEPDQAITPHRIVTAVVVPRGGLGARVSGPAAMEILAAAQSLGYITPKAAPAGAPGAPGTMASAHAGPGRRQGAPHRRLPGAGAADSPAARRRPPPPARAPAAPPRRRPPAALRRAGTTGDHSAAAHDHDHHDSPVAAGGGGPVTVPARAGTLRMARPC